ncbi:MAG: glycosyltransferase family 2 protein [Acidobacteriota bacterium]|nr:glycosyltransferase family 2 protein [Acidobacteriota bacterium]
MPDASADEQPYPLPQAFEPGKIGIVTVTYNSGQVLPEFIESIERQQYRNFVVYAVDNASKDDTIAVLQGWQPKNLVVMANQDNRGVAAGNNQGIRAAIADGCEYVLLLNNDVAFEADLFGGLVEGLQQYSCAMTTPKCYYYEPKDVLWCAGGYFQPRLAYRNLHYGENERDTGQFDTPRAVTYAPTCCVLIRREVFAAVGLMDERYFVYSDDTDFMLRCLRAGQELYYLPELKLWHKVNSLTGTASPFSMRYGVRNRAFFITKHVATPFRQVALLSYAAYYTLRFLLCKDSYQAWKIKRKAWLEGCRMNRIA